MLIVGAIASPSSLRAQTPNQTPRISVAPGGNPQALEDRLKTLEEANQQLLKQVQTLSRQIQQQQQREPDLPSTTPRPSTGSSGMRPPSVIDFLTPPARNTSRSGGAGARDNVSVSDIPSGELLVRPGGGVAAPLSLRPRTNTSRSGGAGARDNVAEPRSPDMGISGGPGSVAGKENIPKDTSLYPLKAEFGPGFQLHSDDNEFLLQFHNLTQADAITFGPGDQQPAHPGFYIPRQRWYFVGRMTKPIEYYTSINRSFGTLDMLDAFINVHYDDRIMWKIGRFKPAFQYEFYAVSETDLIEPERSIVTNNFGVRRNVGTMLWGRLFKKRLDWALGIDDGGRSVYSAHSNSKDVFGYFNARPWGESKKYEFLQYFNIGTSFDFGHENNPVFPTGLRLTQNGQNGTEAAYNSPAFLNFNNNVMEIGDRALFAADMAYFYKAFTFVSEFTGGYESYGFANSTIRPTKVPITGFFVNPTYFLTGEHLTRRTEVRPLKAFDLRKGKKGPGAVELVGRYAMLNMGNQIFTGGYADPNLWTNHVQTIDLGVNWYWNQYVKLQFDYQLAEFGSPVLYRPGGFTWTDNTYWFRFQIYF